MRNKAARLGPGLLLAILPILPVLPVLPVLLVLPGGCGGPAEDPLAPTSLLAEGVPGKAIHVTWTDNRKDESNYELERKDSGAFKVIIVLPFDGAVHHDDDPALVFGTTYTYRVRAKLSNGKYGGYSKEARGQPGGAP